MCDMVTKILKLRYRRKIKNKNKIKKRVGRFFISPLCKNLALTDAFKRIKILLLKGLKELIRRSVDNQYSTIMQIFSIYKENKKGLKRVN